MSGSGRGRPLRAEQDAPMSPAPWLNDIVSRSSVRVPVHLSPDWFVGFPVEVVVDGCPGYVDPSMLGISDGLRRDLESFQIWWEAHASIDDDAPDDAAPEGQPRATRAGVSGIAPAGSWFTDCSWSSARLARSCGSGTRPSSDLNPMTLWRQRSPGRRGRCRVRRVRQR
jgi:hypothetical protein